MIPPKFMKALHFVAPVLAAIAGAFWIGHQESTLIELEERNSLIQERLQQFQSAASSDLKTALVSDKTKENLEFTLPDGTLDWQSIAELISEIQQKNGMPTDMKTFMQLRAKLMEMDENKLVEGLAKIATLNLPENVAKQLRQTLLQILTEKDPKMALDLMGEISTSRGDGLYWTQQSAFMKFASTDPTAALAWLDQQVKDGKFVSKALDPRENPRPRFESALLGRLLESDPAAVQARLATFSDEERKQMFSDLHQWRQQGKMPVEFLEIARQNLDPKEATNTISNAWALSDKGDFTEITEALNEIPFSDQERKAVITRALANAVYHDLTENQLKTTYEWAREHDPGQASSVIVKNLNYQANNNSRLEDSFSKSLKLAESLHAPSIASEFVSQYTRQNKAAWDPSLANFKDPALAEKMRAIYASLATERD